MKMKALINFMNSGVGRGVRVLLGLVLVYAGLFALGGGLTGYVIALIGLVPIAMGAWGHCLLEFAFSQAKQA
jgi:Inner membrane protein YgaP-like, transmembrane domain